MTTNQSLMPQQQTEAVGEREAEPVTVGGRRAQQRNMQMVEGREEGACGNN